MFCNGVNAFNPSCDRSYPLPGNNPFIVGNSKQKRGICTWFPLLQTAISERQIPNVISTPAVTSNINGQPLPPQINHLDIPQNSPNVYNGVNALNSYCGNS
ncbi:unnamed protein product [Rhizophagus irregularis]|uniref:Uncharacterized protein n=1 Tax=Rhizophagus irregularis TaxID=588596 RepID=A0A2N1M7G5_9GLOM|nr:hypothetical protein RhiirC2_797765 [Rhizophagus irregularis]CAB5298683.1 unnamed protein product [Rhizophagus irregularis]